MDNVPAPVAPPAQNLAPERLQVRDGAEAVRAAERREVREEAEAPILLPANQQQQIGPQQAAVPAVQFPMVNALGQPTENTLDQVFGTPLHLVRPVTHHFFQFMTMPHPSALYMHVALAMCISEQNYYRTHDPEVPLPRNLIRYPPDMPPHRLLPHWTSEWSNRTTPIRNIRHEIPIGAPFFITDEEYSYLTAEWMTERFDALRAMPGYHKPHFERPLPNSHPWRVMRLLGSWSFIRRAADFLYRELAPLRASTMAPWVPPAHVHPYGYPIFRFHYDPPDLLFYLAQNICYWCGDDMITPEGQNEERPRNLGHCTFSCRLAFARPLR